MKRLGPLGTGRGEVGRFPWIVAEVVEFELARFEELQKFPVPGAYRAGGGGLGTGLADGSGVVAGGSLALAVRARGLRVGGYVPAANPGAVDSVTMAGRGHGRSARLKLATIAYCCFSTSLN